MLNQGEHAGKDRPPGWPASTFRPVESQHMPILISSTWPEEAHEGSEPWQDWKVTGHYAAGGKCA